MAESSRVLRVLKAELTESSRVPRVLKAEMTPSSRVPRVQKSEMTPSSRVPRVLKAEMTGTRSYWYCDGLWILPPLPRLVHAGRLEKQFVKQQSELRKRSLLRWLQARVIATT